jgi:hypothetical protein
MHVSGDVLAHHQELLTVFTISGNIHQCRCRLVSRMSFNSSMTPAGSDIGEYCKYSKVLLMMGENIAQNMKSLLHGAESFLRS